MLTGPYLNTEFIGMYLDSDNEALKSKKIREAINLGFDRKLMVAFLRNNILYSAIFLACMVGAGTRTAPGWPGQR